MYGPAFLAGPSIQSMVKGPAVSNVDVLAELTGRQVAIFFVGGATLAGDLIRKNLSHGRSIYLLKQGADSPPIYLMPDAIAYISPLLQRG
jgi:hypothetical protein